MIFNYLPFYLIFRYFNVNCYMYTGADPGFQVRGGEHWKKLCRAEGGTKIFGVFNVKNHDFMPKNHIFSNFRGGAPPLDPPLKIMCKLTWWNKQIINKIVKRKMLHKSYDKYYLYIYICDIQIHHKAAFFLINIDTFFLV